MLNTELLFPCVFGIDAVRSGVLRYAFVPVGDGPVEAAPVPAVGLAVLSGSVELFWREGGNTHRVDCGPGTRISLPAHTEHGSTAGPDGCVHV